MIENAVLFQSTLRNVSRQPAELNINLAAD